MNAIEFLVEEHRAVERQLRAIMDAPPTERRALFEKTADLLMSHVLVEERIFYPAVKAERTEDVLLESLEEHLSLKRVLRDLVELDAQDERFEPKLHVLREQAEHHHGEEESHLFPQVEKLFSRERLASLGDRMQAEQVELLRGEPRKLVVTQTRSAADLDDGGRR